MDCSEEGTGVFGITSSDAAPAFEMEEGVFDEVSKPVKVRVVVTLYFAVFLWGDDGLHAL